jgi:hypothetical protein
MDWSTEAVPTTKLCKRRRNDWRSFRGRNLEMHASMRTVVIGVSGEGTKHLVEVPPRQ